MILIKFSYSYNDENKYYFINPKTFEQIEMQRDMIGEKGKLSEVTRTITIKMHDNYYEPAEINVKNIFKIIIYR